jgi:hypothetical protein
MNDFPDIDPKLLKPYDSNNTESRIYKLWEESGPRANIYGGTFVMREMLDWMELYAPEYFK